MRSLEAKLREAAVGPPLFFWRRFLGWHQLPLPAVFGVALLTFVLCGALRGGVLADDSSKLPATVVDFSLPLSGAHRQLGTALQHVAEAAVREVNAQLPRGSSPLSARFQDDKCTRDGAAAVIKTVSAVEPRGRYVLGLPCAASLAGARAALAGTGGGAEILVIATGGAASGNGADVSAKASDFRIFPDWAPGFALGTYLSSLPDTEKVALIRDKTLYAKTLMQQAYAIMQRSKRGPAAVEIINGGDKDFSVLAKRLADQKIDHAAIATFPSEATLLARDLVSASPSIRLTGSDTLLLAEFGEAFDEAAGNLQILVQPDRLDFPDAARVANAIERRQHRVGEAQTDRMALALQAAVQIFAAAIQKTPGAEPRRISEALMRDTFSTALGSLTFAPNGVARLPAYSIRIWRNGRFTVADGN